MVTFQKLQLTSHYSIYKNKIVAEIRKFMHKLRIIKQIYAYYRTVIIASITNVKIARLCNDRNKEVTAMGVSIFDKITIFKYVKTRN